MPDLPVPVPVFLARLEVTPGAVHDLGPTDVGHRRIIDLDGGTVVGERFRGTVLRGGADWQAVLADGTTTVDTRYVVHTDDDALVHVRATGMQAGPPHVLEALARGEEVDPSSYRFRTAMTFETGDVRYRWLTRVLTVCTVARRPGRVVIDAYTVT